ncbi:MAG: hypothetical protein FJ029_02100, partial [Actinobacteria bacterium]|nr:hypothetical protein [Actinomycetota bacterium]
MLWLRYVGFALAVGGAWWFGAELAARALGARTRLTRVALGSGAGLVALGVPLLWLPRILPPGQALLLSGLALGAAAALLRRWPAAPAEVDSPRAALALGSLVVLVYLSALAFWIDGVTGGGDVATRYLHSGVATGIARGNFPVRNPYEPDYALQYRVTFHTLAAGAMDLLDAPARAVMPQAVAATAAILVLTAFGVLRAVAGITAALVGAALTYAWGPLYWVAALLAARERGLGDVLGVIVEQPDTIAWSGILLGGPFTMPTHNPTVSFAMIPAFVTAHTAWVAMRGRARPLLRWGGVAAGLTYLGAANEFLLFTLPAGLLLVLWVRGGLRFQGVRRPMLATLGATGVALVLDLTTPGVLAGFLRGDPDVARLQPGLNTTHFGSLPSWGYNSDGPWITWPVTGYHDVALLSPEFLVDGGSVVGLLAVALLWIAWCRGRSSALPWAALATANVAPAIVFRLGHSGADFYRVLHAGVTLAVPALALAAAEAFARAPRWRPLLVPAATAL